MYGVDFNATTQPIPPLSESTYYLLLSLLTPMHGYGIMNNVKKLTNGRLNLAPGTLYGAISILLEKNWIQLNSFNKDKRRKEYILTDSGKDALKEEINRLKELYNNGLKVSEGDH
ncbi:PadR family transcriptional regulator [Paraliobacillus sp. JSM ZJ581]|uniref:PadR family transcriptional regulator n=1 Tax=Paraliobacillus sp. JSM ZJ581 TaxID=3342118 RepID=UPI0035A98C74